MSDPHHHEHAAKTYRRLWRRRLRRVLKPLPRRSNLSRYPVLRHIKHWFAPFPFLWSYRQSETLRAVYLGSIITFLPIMGGQIFVGAVLALLFRANLTIMTALQFVSNPLTGPFMYALSYLVGRAIAIPLHLNELGWAGDAAVNLSIGGLVCGIALGGIIHLVSAVYRARYRHLLAPTTTSPDAA